jgi:hypothetical protein
MEAAPDLSVIKTRKSTPREMQVDIALARLFALTYLQSRSKVNGSHGLRTRK